MKDNFEDNTNESYIKDYEKNVDFFLNLARYIKYIWFFLAIAFIFVFIVGLSIHNITTIILGITCSIFCIIFAFIIPPFLEWKAYMLENLYMINNKKGK